MTFLQPNKKSSFVNSALALLAAALVAGVFGMVALYNVTVNLNHNIETAKKSLDAIGAANTELNNKVVVALGAEALGKLAANVGLVAEPKPQYFPLRAASNEQWPIASHY